MDTDDPHLEIARLKDALTRQTRATNRTANTAQAWKYLAERCMEERTGSMADNELARRLADAVITADPTIEVGTDVATDIIGDLVALSRLREATKAVLEGIDLDDYDAEQFVVVRVGRLLNLNEALGQ